jgi:hypothetical protein
MRGGPAPMARGGPPVRPSNEATARPYSHPSPYGGWNARGNLANMDPEKLSKWITSFQGFRRLGLEKGALVGLLPRQQLFTHFCLIVG